MKYLLILIAASSAISYSLSARSEPLDVASNNNEPIGHYAYFLKETTSPLSLKDAINAFSDEHFTRSKEAFLSFGIGSKAVWLRFDIRNRTNSTVSKRLMIKNSWIDKIDVYFLRNNQVAQSYHTGDAQPFSVRPLENRFFIFDHVFQPGTTTLYIRTATPDPMVLPVYLSSIDAFVDRQMLEAYSYGFLYGGIFVLLAYNLMLFFSLKSSRYLYYSFYLTFFLITNISYTGHGFMWLWPDSPRWQLWSNPVLMMAFAISGLLFATRFLNTKKYFPRLHRTVIYGSAGFAAMQVLAVVSGSHLAALLLAFFFIFVFSASMVFLGAISLYAGNKSAKYFLAASITHVSTSSVTALVVWGIMPYSILAYRAIDIGMMIDAILLAMALADQFRISRQGKIQAEKLAKVDPLTEINNRRAFYQFVRPIWSTGQRHKHDMSIILLDIDRFKRINDTYGHAHGDRVLISLATMLKNEIRAGDVLARWGGEEFVLFLPETRLDTAKSIAERFRKKISELCIQAGSDTLFITVSLGVAHTDKADMTIDKLITAADKQLYSAKEQGRDRVC
ncbi:MAG TPA: GGDEF domain-containing protein [Gammaproteobacteria bacterium]|nr:GGDEF domain-containing protein [Gammaproteobacteria bacterium]